VDWSNPQDVAAAMLSALWSLDTTTTASSQTTEMRASAYCTPTYGAQLRTLAPGAPPDGTWTLWAAHRATTTVALSAAPDAGAPVDTPTRAYVEDVATVSPEGSGGWRGSPEIWVEFVTLTRVTSAARWLVSGVETTP